MSDALPSTLPPELVPFAFLLGRWRHGSAVEDWVAAGDVWIEIPFEPDRYGVSMIDRVDGVTRYVAQPEGGAPVVYAQTSGSDGLAVFADPTHSAPRLVSYEPDGPKHLRTPAGRYKHQDLVPAPALEAADLAFAAAVTARGVDAWVEAFDPAGHQWNDAKGAIPPGPAMREHMADILAGHLAWHPTHSALAPSGDLGWTVGDWAWTPPDATVPTARGVYVTVWREEPDGSWKVWFDTGNPL